MSLIRVNNEITVEGKFSFGVDLDDSAKPAKLVISGAFQSAEYIEDITKLENERYILQNIKVKHEGFGSEEEIIVYSFTAGSFRVKPK
jgi:hypothetical protein